jgi:hypothetical protein
LATSTPQPNCSRAAGETLLAAANGEPELSRHALGAFDRAKRELLDALRDWLIESNDRRRDWMAQAR